MIVSDTFIWVHFPKCAGHTVDQAIRSVTHGRSDIRFDQRTEMASWHHSPEDRRKSDPSLTFADRRIISGFRRLPYWILSRVHYDASRSPYLTATRDMLLRGEFFERNGLVQRADAYAEHYSRSGVQRWIRTEHLAEDFERHFGDVLGSQLARAAVRKLRKVVNGSRLNYGRDLAYHFTPAELDGLYAANPVWAAIEREIYGDLLSLRAVPAYFYAVDRNLRFLAVDQRTLAYWEMNPDDVLGRDILSVFPAADGSEAYDAIVGSLRTRKEAHFSAESPTFGVNLAIDIEPQPFGLRVSFAPAPDGGP